MRLAQIIAAAAVCATSFSTVSAGEMADACIAALEAEGRDTSGCTCLEDAVSESAALQEEFQTLGAIADPAERYAAASDEAQAAMDQCTR